MEIGVGIPVGTNIAQREITSRSLLIRSNYAEIPIPYLRPDGAFIRLSVCRREVCLGGQGASVVAGEELQDDPGGFF